MAEIERAKNCKHWKFPAGENNPRSKLLDHEVETIRQLLETGMSQAEVVVKFEISPSQVSKIANYKQR